MSSNDNNNNDNAVNQTTDYKSLAVKLSLWAQGKGIPGASPAWLTRAAKRIADSSNPKIIEGFIRNYKIDYTEAERCTAANSARSCAKKYGTLNEFFTRRIRNIRIDDANIVSPATCKAVVFDSMADSTVWVKGRRWSASRLLKLPVSFSRFAVGIFRLRPADYHRFHAPFDAIITSIRHIPGSYLSVDPAVVSKRNVFTENNRAIVALETPVYGRCYFVAVGAAGVGSVVISAPKGRISAGDELGYFQFGGSTVLVLVPNVDDMPVWDPTLLQSSLAGVETVIDVGQGVSI